MRWLINPHKFRGCSRQGEGPTGKLGSTWPSAVLGQLRPGYGWVFCLGSFSCHNNQALSRDQGHAYESPQVSEKFIEQEEAWILRCYTARMQGGNFQVQHLRFPHIQISLTNKKHKYDNNHSHHLLNVYHVRHLVPSSFLNLGML